MIKKFLLFLLLPLVLFVFISNNRSFFVQKTKEVIRQEKNQIVVYQKIYPLNDFKEIKIKKGKTALDLLKENEKIVKRGDGKNAFITSINNRVANNSKKEFWAFYINNKYAEVGAGSYVLKSLDKIEWKIQTY